MLNIQKKKLLIASIFLIMLLSVSINFMGKINADENTITLVTGQQFNAKIKQLVNSSAVCDTSDTTITSIEFTTDALTGTETTVNVASSGEALAYLDGNDVKIHIDESIEKIYLNADSSYMYSYFENLNSLTINPLMDTSNVTDMEGMFYNCGRSSTTFTLDLGNNFDTSNVTNMGWMFRYCGFRNKTFTLDLGDKFDTSKVTSMFFMFSECGYSSTTFTLDLRDKFSTSNVTDMSGMFNSCGESSTCFTLDLGNKFDTSNVTNMYDMFCNCGYSSTTFTLDLRDKFNTSKVTNMEQMFHGCGRSNTTFTLDLGDKFDTSNVANMNRMFSGCGESSTIFTLDLSSFDLSLLTSYINMFGFSNEYGNVFCGAYKIYLPSNINSITDIALRKKNGYVWLGKDSLGNISDSVTLCTNLIQASTSVNYIELVKEDLSYATVDDIVDQRYTGSIITPDITVKMGDITLTKDIDYTLSYSNNSSIGTATITITGINNYSTSTTKTFKIVSAEEADNNFKKLINNATSDVVIYNNIGKYLDAVDTEDKAKTTYENLNIILKQKVCNYLYNRKNDSTYTNANDIYNDIKNMSNNTISKSSEYLKTNDKVIISDTNYDKYLTYTIEKLTFPSIDMETFTSSTSYPFKMLTSDDNYYYIASTNNGVNSSTSDAIYTIDVTKAVDITIGYIVSSEASYDKLYIYLNGSTIGTYSGTSTGSASGTTAADYTYLEKTLSLVSGTNTIKFAYTKDGLDASGKDKAYIRMPKEIIIETYETLGTMINGSYTITEQDGNTTYRIKMSLTNTAFTTNTTFYESLTVGTDKITLLPGKKFNAKVKQLVNSSATYETGDTTITSIEFSTDTLTGSETTVNVASSGNALAYLDGTDVKIHIDSFVTKIYLNEDSSYMYNTFQNLNSLTIDPLIDTSNVIDMEGMFNGCGFSSTTFTLDLGDNFDTNNVTNMNYMFDTCGLSSTCFTLDLGDKFDTSNVTNMIAMFEACGQANTAFTLDLGDNFDTSNVTDMEGMFYSCGRSSTTFTLDLGENFNTSNVTNMDCMFYSCGHSSTTFTLDLSTFNLSSLTTHINMFDFCGATKIYLPSNINSISNIELPKETNYMWIGSDSLGNAESSATSYTNLIQASSSVNYIELVSSDISNATVSTIPNQEYTGSNITPNVTVKIGDVTLTKDIDYTVSYSNNTNVGKATITINGIGIFIGTKQITFIIVKFDEIALVTGNEFNAAIKQLVNSSAYYYTEDTTITSIEFSTDALQGTEITVNVASSGEALAYLDGTDVKIHIDSSIKKIYLDSDSSYMYYNFINLNSLKINHLIDTSNVTNMSGMFYNCGYNSTIFTLDLGDNFDTSNVTNMRLMFYNCGYNSTVFTFDLGSKFYSTTIESISNAFYECNIIRKLDLSKFDFSALSDLSKFASKCLNLEYLNLSSLELYNYETSKMITNDYQKFMKEFINDYVDNIDDAMLEAYSMTREDAYKMLCEELGVNVEDTDNDIIESIAANDQALTMIVLSDSLAESEAMLGTCTKVDLKDEYKGKTYSELGLSEGAIFTRIIANTITGETATSGVFYVENTLPTTIIIKLSGDDETNANSLKTFLTDTYSFSSDNRTLTKYTNKDEYNIYYLTQTQIDNLTTFMDAFDKETVNANKIALFNKLDKTLQDLLVNNYTWTNRAKYNPNGKLALIAPAKEDISGATVTNLNASYTYTGKDIIPNVTVKLGATTFVQYTDYEVFYTNNKNAGTATITILGKGDYSGTITKKFTIEKCNIDSNKLVLENSKYVSKERDGDNKVKDSLVISYTNENVSSEKVYFTYDEALYSQITPGEDLDITVKNVDINSDTDINGSEILNNYTFTKTNVTYSSYGKIVDTTGPKITSIKVSDAKTYIKGQKITFVIESDEDMKVNTSEDVKLIFRGVSGDKENTLTSNVSLTFNNATDTFSKSKEFYYTVQDGDMALNGLSIVAIESTSGTLFEDAYGNNVQAFLINTVTDDNVSKTYIDTNGFSVSITPSSTNLSNNVTIDFDVTYTFTFGNDVTDGTFTDSDVLVNGESSYAGKGTLTKVDSKTYQMTISNLGYISSSDTEGKDFTVSIDKGTIKDISSKDNIAQENTIKILRTLNEVTSNVANNSVQKGSTNITFTSDNTSATLSYQLSELGEIITTGTNSVVMTLKDNATNGVLSVINIFASLSEWANSNPVTFNYTVRNINHVYNDIKESNTLAKIKETLQDSDEEDLLKLTTDEKSKLTNSSILNEVSQNVYDNLSSIKDGEELSAFIKDAINLYNIVENDYSTPLSSSTYDPSVNYELLMIEYETLDNNQKAIFDSKVISGSTQTYYERLREYYLKYIDGNVTRKNTDTNEETNDTYVTNAAVIEAYGLVNYTAKESSSDKVELVVEKITNTNEINKLENTIDKATSLDSKEKVLMPYDIYLAKVVETGTETTREKINVQDGKKILIKLEMPKEYANDILNIYHIDDSKNVEKLSKTISVYNDKCNVYFYGTSFSDYVVTSGTKSIVITKEDDGNINPYGLLPLEDGETSKTITIIVPNGKQADLYVNDKKVKTYTKEGTYTYTLENINDNVYVKLIFNDSSSSSDSGSSSSGTSSGGGSSSSKGIETLEKITSHKAIMKGCNDGTFGTNKNLTRQEIATILARLSSDFDSNKDYTPYIAECTDVKITSWSANYIGYVVSKGIMTLNNKDVDGENEKVFYPTRDCTRYEIAKIICTFKGWNAEGLTSTFKDSNGSQYDKYVAKLYNEGLVNGMGDGTFNGKGNLTRAEFCKLLCIMLDRQIKNTNKITKSITTTVCNKFSDVLSSSWYFPYVVEMTYDHSSNILH